MAKAIDQRLQLLEPHLSYHEPDHVLDIAYNILCDGDRLEDIERLRNDELYLDALGADIAYCSGIPGWPLIFRSVQALRNSLS